MKAQLVLPMTVAVSVALLGVMKLRQKEHEQVDKRSRFQDIKLRVTYDVLGEYENERVETQVSLEQSQAEARGLQEQVRKLQQHDHKRKAELDVCQGAHKSEGDEVASLEAEFSNVQAVSNKEKTSWNTEISSLEQQLGSRSEICNFLKPGEQVDRKMCQEVIVKAPIPEPKADAPKPEDTKQEVQKPEEPKPAEPKPEEPKPEAQKPEEPKPEAQKPEAQKPEAQKPEEPKPEEPKPEEPKPEEPKPEEPKPAEPGQEAPKPEPPKPEAPKRR